MVATGNGDTAGLAETAGSASRGTITTSGARRSPTTDPIAIPVATENTNAPTIRAALRTFTPTTSHALVNPVDSRPDRPPVVGTRWVAPLLLSDHPNEASNESASTSTHRHRPTPRPATAATPIDQQTERGEATAPRSAPTNQRASTRTEPSGDYGG
ncbi:hypothetical protein Vqi01_06520 [Micromonospora qiuiae]|uniref:Uncharacterized protein n=1 Tax=Micromonospora qiuiae TaxID=502268 RepID=A0ABQ4J653_9ACTN|nr:hypothetical protein Vqi01_06520 [Micromonospora qiuiae]